MGELSSEGDPLWLIPGADEPEEPKAEDLVRGCGVAMWTGRGGETYYVGVIDILQLYNTRKNLETRLKSLAYKQSTISCVDPKQYAQRFESFVTMCASGLVPSSNAPVPAKDTASPTKDTVNNSIDIIPAPSATPAAIPEEEQELRASVVRVSLEEEYGGGFVTLRCGPDLTVRGLKAAVLAKHNAKSIGSTLSEQCSVLFEADSKGNQLSRPDEGKLVVCVCQEVAGMRYFLLRSGVARLSSSAGLEPSVERIPSQGSSSSGNNRAFASRPSSEQALGAVADEVEASSGAAVPRVDVTPPAASIGLPPVPQEAGSVAKGRRPSTGPRSRPPPRSVPARAPPRQAVTGGVTR